MLCICAHLYQYIQSTYADRLSYMFVYVYCEYYIYVWISCMRMKTLLCSVREIQYLKKDDNM